MKRNHFLKQLILLPLGFFFTKGFFQGKLKSGCLLNKFYVAGFQYYQGAFLIHKISVGERLTLVADHKNRYDRFAVAILRQGVMIGHVPRTDNKHLHRLLKHDTNLHCTVIKSNPERETWEMLKVEVSL